MTCKKCGAITEGGRDICALCDVSGTKDVDIYGNSNQPVSNKPKKTKQPLNRAKLAVSITSVVLIVLVFLTFGYIIIDSLGREKIPTVSEKDAEAILTAFNGPTLGKIKEKFRSADSDSSRQSARDEAFKYFSSLKEIGTIDSVELSSDGTKIYFEVNYTESVFVMDDPTADTYNASTIVAEDFSESFNGIYSSHRDFSDFKLGTENNILILNATDNHKSVYEDLDSTLYYFEDANLNVNFIEYATLDDFSRKLGKYNMIFIHAQSFKSRDNKTVIALNEKATKANIVGYSAQLANRQSSVYSGMMSDNPSFTVNDKLITENYKSVMPNSLVYLGFDNGYGGGNNAFADAFSAAGAKVIVGYSGNVSAAYEAKCVKDAASCLISGKTISDTLQLVVSNNGESDGDEAPAFFGYYGPNDWSLYGWELFSGIEATEITSDEELFDTLNYAMLALGTKSISKDINGYRIIDADKDGSKELFMMTVNDDDLITNLAFDTLANAKIAVDSSKSEDYDFRTFYDSANSTAYLCEQFKSGSDAKTLYSWTNMGWEIFAKYSDEKSGKPTYIWDNKHISKEAFDANLKKASQGALLNNWQSMLNLYYQVNERNKIINDLITKFKAMNGTCESLLADFDKDSKNEGVIVLSGYGSEWLSNTSIMANTGREQILHTPQFGTFAIYIDETDVGIVFRVVYISDVAKEKIKLSANENGGVDVYFEEDLLTVNVKFNGEVTERSGYTVTAAYDESVFSLMGVWSVQGHENAEITFTGKDDGLIVSKNYSFKKSAYENGKFKHEFIVEKDINGRYKLLVKIDGTYKEFGLDWGTHGGKAFALNDAATATQSQFIKKGDYTPSGTDDEEDTSSNTSSNTSSDVSSGTSSGENSSGEESET